jgi:hypothetical protein
MAYDRFFMSLLSNPVRTNCPNIWTYISATDTAAQVRASAYFNEEMPPEGRLQLNDIIYSVSTDGNEWLYVTAVTPNVTTAVATNTIGVGAVTTSAIADGAVTSAKLSPLTVQYASVAVSAAEFNGMYAAPKLLIPAAGVNTLLVLDRVVLAMTYGSAAYAAGGVAAVQYDDTANGAGVIASTTLAAASFQDTASTVYSFNAGVVEYPFATCVNQGLYLSNITAAFTTGDSDMVAHVWYKVIPTV